MENGKLEIKFEIMSDLQTETNPNFSSSNFNP